VIRVFAGPSLPACDRPDDRRLAWHPPAKAGDIIALLDDPPDRLCLIDGLFDSCPAPWHKELLLLQSRGTFLFGAASMGALRAAELDRHGMIGVGWIYRAYRDGRLTGDDEVALAHAPEPLDWEPLSIPMVEIRATLVRACIKKVIVVDQARRLRSLFHDIHYADRSWPKLRMASEGLVDLPTFTALRALHVPLKRLDAMACIAAALAMPGDRPAWPAPPITWHLKALAFSLGRSL